MLKKTLYFASHNVFKIFSIVIYILMLQASVSDAWLIKNFQKGVLKNFAFILVVSKKMVARFILDLQKIKVFLNQKGLKLRRVGDLPHFIFSLFLQSLESSLDFLESIRVNRLLDIRASQRPWYQLNTRAILVLLYLGNVFIFSKEISKLVLLPLVFIPVLYWGYRYASSRKVSF